MVSRNNLKKAATVEGGKTLSIDTQKKYLGELEALSFLNKTQERAKNILEKRVFDVENKECVSDLKSTKKAEAHFKTLGFAESLSDHPDAVLDAYEIVRDTRSKIGDVFSTL